MAKEELTEELVIQELNRKVAEKLGLSVEELTVYRKELREKTNNVLDSSVNIKSDARGYNLQLNQLYHVFECFRDTKVKVSSEFIDNLWMWRDDYWWNVNFCLLGSSELRKKVKRYQEVFDESAGAILEELEKTFTPGKKKKYRGQMKIILSAFTNLLTDSSATRLSDFYKIIERKFPEVLDKKIKKSFSKYLAKKRSNQV